MTANMQLAEQARQLADRAGRGTLDRKAGLCAAVLLSETRSVAAATKLLADIRQADIRTRAAQLLGDLAEGATT